MSDQPDYENPTIVGGGENAASWDHSKIKDAFDPLAVDDAVAQAEKYWQIRQYWEQGFETFLRSVQTSLSQAWSGAAAEKSRRAIEDYINTQARPLVGGLEVLYSSVNSAADAIVRTKNSLPDEFDDSNMFARGWNRMFASDEEIGRRTEEAQTMMKTNYVLPFGELDTKVPVLPAPTGPTTGTETEVIPPGGKDDGTGGDIGGGGITGGGDERTGGTSSETPGGGEEQAAGQAAGEQATTGDSGSSAPGETTEAGAGASDGDWNSPEDTTAASTGGGSAGSSGYPGSSSGGGGSGGSSGGSDSQSPGRTVQGSPGGTATGTAAAVTGTAGTGSSGRGMSGMPMGGAGARGNQRDDETNRTTPDYLVTQQNTEELLGETPPTITGGVIGANPE